MAANLARRSLLIDVHTHVYLPRYASLLRSRSAVPKILTRQTKDGKGQEDRLVILDDEPSGGRPVGAQYWDRDEKLKFMDLHGIDVSIVSSANPWLDFLPPVTAFTLAKELNTDLEEYCSSSPATSSHPNVKRLYGFGLLPLVPTSPSSSEADSDPIAAILSTISQISQLPHLKGIIMGTRGLGKGLDDARLDGVWEALEREKLAVFLHPHYGVGKDAWGERENGHVLPLALGFPFETTIAATRLILSGVFDRYPDLRILLAHSGGALPQLSSRLASCIIHDPEVASRLKHDARYYISKLWYDAVAYGAEELGFVGDVIGRGQSGGRKKGSERMLFGTDHPFFPPLEGKGEQWMSVVENLNAIEKVEGWGVEEKEAVMGGNAVRLFSLA